MSRRLLGLLPLLLLAACARDGGKMPGGARHDPQVQAYDVPADRADDVARVLSSLLGPERDTTGQGAAKAPALGRVQRIGEGTLLVLAPAGMQRSIGETIHEILASKSARATPATPATPVTLQVWQLEEAPAGVEPPSLPKTLSPVLEAVHKEFEAASLKLVDVANVTLLSGADNLAMLTTANGTTITGSIPAGNPGSMLEVRLSSSSINLNTTVPLQLNQYVVLAQAGIGVSPVRQRFVVIRASRPAARS